MNAIYNVSYYKHNSLSDISRSGNSQNLDLNYEFQSCNLVEYLPHFGEFKFCVSFTGEEESIT
jgi:hypothetical protein